MGTSNLIFNMDPQAMLEGAGDMKDRVEGAVTGAVEKTVGAAIAKAPGGRFIPKSMRDGLAKNAVAEGKKDPSKAKALGSLPCATADPIPLPTLHVHPTRKRP